METNNKPSISHYQYSKQWYARNADASKNEIMIGSYYPDGGCDWEFAIHQDNLSGPVVYVHMYDDGVQSLANPLVANALASLHKCGTLEEASRRLILAGIPERDPSPSPYEPASRLGPC